MTDAEKTPNLDGTSKRKTLCHTYANIGVKLESKRQCGGEIFVGVCVAAIHLYSFRDESKKNHGWNWALSEKESAKGERMSLCALKLMKHL